MTTPSIVILILLSYGTAMLLISRRASRRIRSFQDTIAAPGQTSLFLLARQRHRRPNRQRICHRRCGIRRPLRHCGRLVWYRLRAFLLYHCGPVPFHPHPSLCLPGRLFCPPLQRSCDPYDLYCRKYLLQRFSAGRAASGRKGHIPDIGPSGPVGCRPDCGYRAGILKRRWFMGVYGSLLHPERHYLYRNVHSPVSDDVRSRSWGTGSRSACFQLSSSALWRRIFSLYDCSHRFGKLSEPDLIPERRLCQIPQIGQRRLSSGRTDIDPGRIHSANAGHVRRALFPGIPAENDFPLCCSRAFPPPWPP